MPKQRTQIPFGPFDVSVPRHDASPGVLRAVRNLVPDGSPERPRWSAAEGAAQLGELDGILALGAQVRSRQGSLSDSAPTVSAGFYDDTTGDYVLTPLPVGLYGHGAGIIGNELIIAGGATTGGAEARTWAYDFKADRYDQVADVPEAMFDVASAVLASRLHIVGGNDGSGVTAKHYRYDPALDEWVSLAALPAARTAGVLVADPTNGTLHYLGGDSGSGEVDTHYVYDAAADSWSTSTAIPATTKWAQAAIDAGTIYLIGGTSSGTIVTTVRTYDISADTWGTVAALPTERHKGGAAIIGGSIYVMGGENSGGEDSSVEAFDISGGTWSDPGHTMPDAHDFPSVNATGSWILAAGGQDGQSALNAMRAYAPAQAERLKGPIVTGLERLAAITRDGVHMIDPDSGAHKRIYTFLTKDDSRKAQFGQIGDDLWIATATGAGVGTPEQVLQVKDDAVIPLNLPPLPLVALTQANEGNSALQAGKYAYRYAWVLQDGTVGPASRPYLFTIEDASSPATLTFQISQFTFPLGDAWNELIRGVAIFLSEEAFSLAEAPGGGEKPLERLLNAPYYKVLTLTALDTSTTTEWTDVKEAIPTYPQLDDEQLTRHQLKAAALFSYNKRLFLGDTSVDFQRLQGTLNLVGAGGAIGENTPPTVTYTGDGADTLYVEGASDAYTFQVADPDGDFIDTITVTKNDGPGVSSSYTTALEYSQDGGSTWATGAPASVDAALWRVKVTLTVDTISSANEIVLTVEATDTLGDTGSDLTGIQVEYTDDQEGGS